MISENNCAIIIEINSITELDRITDYLLLIDYDLIEPDYRKTLMGFKTAYLIYNHPVYIYIFARKRACFSTFKEKNKNKCYYFPISSTIIKTI